MDPAAVDQAKVRLQKAEKALQELQVATNYDEAESAWIDFLVAASTIYSKLQQGAKPNATSRAWYDIKKTERKNDPLLRYLHQARNSEEHGIERVVARGGNPRDLPDGRPLKFGERVAKKIQIYDKDNKTPMGEPMDAYLYGPSVGLVRVHDRRSNTHYDPPMQHLGQAISLDDNHIHGIGTIGLNYLKGIVAEAEAQTLVLVRQL
jgi:hypothetical protein